MITFIGVTLFVLGMFGWLYAGLLSPSHATGGEVPAPPAVYVEPHWIWRERLDEALATLTVADLPRWPESGAEWFESESWRRTLARTQERILRKALAVNAFAESFDRTATRSHSPDREEIRNWGGQAVRVLESAETIQATIDAIATKPEPKKHDVKFSLLSEADAW